METPHVEERIGRDDVDIYGDVIYSSSYMTFFDESYYIKWTCETPIERSREYLARYSNSPSIDVIAI